MYEDIRINFICRLIDKYIKEKNYIKVAEIYANNVEIIEKYKDFVEQEND